MKARLYPQQLVTLIGHFNANVAMSHEVEEYLKSLTFEKRNEIKSQMESLIKEKEISVLDIYNVTSFKPTDDHTALKFFTAVYLYAFEDGEEPDIDDYRPKWSV